MPDNPIIGITATTHFQSQGQIPIHELPGAVPYGETALPLQAEDVAFRDQLRSDASMLAEANMNREESEQFIATRGLIGRWNLAEIMLRAWVEPVKWKGSDQMRSHLGIPLVAETFYSVHSAVNQALLGGYRVFKIDATAGTPLGCAEAQEAILNTELKNCGYKGVSLKTEMREVTYDGLFYGFGVAHYGWTKIKQDVIKKVPKIHTLTLSINGNQVTIPVEDEDDVEPKVIGTIEINQPRFEHVPIRRARYAPDLRRGDPRCGEWFGRIIYLTGYDLDALRNTDGWKIPTREELIKLMVPQMMSGAATNPLETLGSNTGNPIFQQVTTPQKAYPENYTERNQHDPLGRKFELFDYWTGFRHCIVLQKEYCILNETHKFRCPPFLGFCFRNAPDAAHGYGIAFWLTDFQRVAQGIINATMDDLNLNLMGTYSSPAGMNNSAQNQWIFPGKIFKSDPGGEFKAIERNSINLKEPLDMIAQLKTWAASIVGVGPNTLGANPGTAGSMRTPAGVEAISGGESVKMQDLIDIISEQVFVPFLEFCIEENQKLKPSQIRAMLSQTLGDAFKQTPLDILNGAYRVEISAGQKLAAREALNKTMGFMESILTAPGTVENLAIQAMKLDFNVVYSSLLDAFGLPYKDKIIVPQTDEDKARYLANTQAAAMQGKLGVIHATADEKQKTDDNQAENRTLIETAKHTLATHGADHQATIDAAQAKAEAATPEAEGLQRAAKSAFASQDKAAFG